MLIYQRRHLKVIYEKNLRHKRYLSSALNISFLFFSQDAPGPQVQLLWTRLLLQPPATVFRCLGSYVAQQRVCAACGHTAAISFTFEAWCPLSFDRHKNGAHFDDSSKTISRHMASLYQSRQRRFYREVCAPLAFHHKSGHPGGPLR